MTKLLQMAVPVVLALLCLIPIVDAPTRTGIHEGFRLRECDGGTAWNEVKTGDCPLTSPIHGIQPVMRCTCASRTTVSCSKKPRRLQQKRLKICSRSNIILLLLLLLSGDIETNPGPIASINPSSICGRKERAYHQSSTLLNFVPRSEMSILLWETEVTITGDKVAQKHTMIHNLDVCHAVVECTPAPKATKDMRKRKLAHHRFQQCYRLCWVTLACIAYPFIVCMIVMLIVIYNRRNQQEWKRKEGACQVTKQYVCCAMLHYNKVYENQTRCKPRVFESEEETARNRHVYLQTAVSIFCHLGVSAVVIAMSLLLSGDVEVNPGPLTSCDLKDIINSVWEARARWFHIGIQLSMNVAVLEAIKSNHHDQLDACLTAMLTEWLKQTDPKPNWEALVTALKNPSVGCGHLADAIERTYYNKGMHQQLQGAQASSTHPASGGQFDGQFGGPGQQQLEYQYGIYQPPRGQQPPSYLQLQHNVQHPPPSEQQYPQSQYSALQPPPGQQHPQLQYGAQHPPPGQQQPEYPQSQYGAQQQGYPQSQYSPQHLPPGQQKLEYTQPQYSIQSPPPDQQQPGYLQSQYIPQHPPPGQHQPGYTQSKHDVQQSTPGQQHPGYPQHGVQRLPPSQKQPWYSQSQYGAQQQPGYPLSQHSAQHPPPGQHPQSQHGTQHSSPGQQQPWYTQPQYSVIEPPPSQQQSGYLYGIQQPLPDWQQPRHIQPRHDFQPPPGQQQPRYSLQQHDAEYPFPGQQQPRYPQAQYGNQHPPTGQQYHTNTQLQQPPPSGQFTGERQAASTHQELSVTFASENQAAITAKFAAFQTNVCDKLVKNGVNIEQLRSFVTNQFPPGDCIPPPPASFTEIFKAITYHGLWNYLHYSPLVHIVQTFGANDTEMKGWVQNYQKDLKAYTLVTKLEDYIEVERDTAQYDCAKYDPRYCQAVEWEIKFVDHSLHYLNEVWLLFSGRYLMPDSPPTALLEHVRKGCFSVTWLIPSGLIPSLIKRMKSDTDFFKQYRILKMTVSNECVYEEVTDEDMLEPLLAQQKETLLSKAPLIHEGRVEPHGSPKVEKTLGGYDCKFVEQPPSAFQTDCPVCCLLLRDPHQATCCGTSFCHSCILQVKAIHKPCPTCREENFEIFQDKRLKRSLNQLRVLCTYSKDGCKWKGELGDLDHHLNKVIHHAAQSSSDFTHVSEVDSTTLAVYAENLKARYRCKAKRKDVWPPQITKKYFNLALIKEETVRKAEVSDEFTRLTITGKIEDILQKKLPIKLAEVFKKTIDHKRMTILMEGCPGSGKTALTQHLCLEWVQGKLFKDYKLVILVRLREPAIHKAKEVKEILPRVGMEEDAAKEIKSSHGRGVLFILDGWDELPEDVPGHDTVYDIISGETLPECDAVITSRPTLSASLHDTDLISSRIEILGFTPRELHQFFTEHLDHNVSKANTLLQKIKANPIVSGTCALPLNAVILAHIFKQHGDLPTTEHGIFEALIRNCILRHVTERTEHKIRVLKSLANLPTEVKPQYHKLCKIAYNGVMDDYVIFELTEDFNTLGLLQGVECYSSYGTQYFYNFIHLSIQEFLAAQHIATFIPAEQIAEFDKLFGQARFSSTFRHYSAITKLTTPGIDKIVLRIVKENANDTNDENNVHFLSLLNCLREAQEPSLYKFVADNLGPKLDLWGITLNPADCLSVNHFLKYTTDIEADLHQCSIDADGCRMLFSQDQVYQLRVLNLGGNQIGDDGVTYMSAAMKNMVNLQELELSDNNLSDSGIEALSTALEKLVHLQKLYLSWNNITDSGLLTLSATLEKLVNLQVLYLQVNQIGDGSVETLRQLIKTSNSLNVLFLGARKFTKEGQAQLRQAVNERNPDFVELMVYFA